MPFDYGDLETPEVALLALEYLRNTATTMQEAAAGGGTIDGETARALSEVASSIARLHGDLEARMHAHYGDAVPEDARLSARLHRQGILVAYDEPGPEVGSLDVLEVACAEQEEIYQFFLEEAQVVDDPWLRQLFLDIGEHAHGIVQYLEAERESLADAEGAQ